MTPDSGQPPVKLALAIMFDHPEILTLDPVRAAQVQQRIVKAPSDPHFADVWQYISAHPLDGDDPWAAQQPIASSGADPLGTQREPICQWTLSPGLCAVIQEPLASVLPAVRAAHPARRSLRQDPVLVSQPPGAMTGATDDWTLSSLPTRHGLQILSAHYDEAATRCTFQLQNVQPRHLAVYVQFFTAGAPTTPTSWASRLPPALRDVLENTTTKFVGMLPPTVSLAGMTLSAAPTELTVDLPGPEVSVRLLFGGPGLGDLDLVTDAAAALVTAVLDFAVPVILDGAHAGLTKAAWFNQLLTDPDVLAEILGATRFLFTGPAPADSTALLQAISNEIPTLLLGPALPTLRASIATNIGAHALTDAAAVLGWACAELAAQAQQPLQAAAASTLLSAPGTFALDLSPVVVTVQPDLRHGMWPDQATTYRVSAATADTVWTCSDGTLPATANAPVPIIVPALPAGEQLIISATVADGGGTHWGEVTSAPMYVPAADRTPQPLALSITERPVDLTATTAYRHRQKLIFDPATSSHRWQTGPAPTAVGLVPAPGAAFRHLGQLALQDRSGDIGYAWQGGDPAAQYAFATIGVIVPETRSASSGPAFAQPALLAYSPSGPDVYLDPTSYALDQRFHLRGVTLQTPMSFDLHQQSSLGSFAADPDRVLIHPGGWAIGCFTAQGALTGIRLPASAVPMDQAPEAAWLIGPGSEVGSVDGPTAAAVTSTGLILVLEQGNVRIQAFDPYGNAHPYFGGSSPVLDLTTGSGTQTGNASGSGPVSYLDLALGSADVIYVLSCTGTRPQAADYRIQTYTADGTPLASTTGVAAARLATDGWGRVYTLNYEALEGPGGQLEPTISQWIPNG